MTRKIIAAIITASIMVAASGVLQQAAASLKWTG